MARRGGKPGCRRPECSAATLSCIRILISLIYITNLDVTAGGWAAHAGAEAWDFIREYDELVRAMLSDRVGGEASGCNAGMAEGKGGQCFT